MNRMWKEYNPNPKARHTDDCVVRALTILLDCGWDEAYLKLATAGYELKTMPTTNYTWESLLKKEGFVKRILPDTCPDCYTVKKFCEEHKDGFYLLATGSHVVTVVDGDYCDTWDSGDEIITYYFEDNEAEENE